jgi:hypothetical protein
MTVQAASFKQPGLSLSEDSSATLSRFFCSCLLFNCGLQSLLTEFIGVVLWGLVLMVCSLVIRGYSVALVVLLGELFASGFESISVSSTPRK